MILLEHRITYADGSYRDVDSSDMTGVINSRLSISSDQCNSGTASSQPIFIVESNPDMFLGVYQPDAETIYRFLDANSVVGDQLVASVMQGTHL